MNATIADEDQGRASRTSEATRAALIKAAVAVFAEHGYDGGSVRQITKKAGANQAAINYHFGGKPELYRAVLQAARDALEAESFLSLEELDALAPEAALRRYLRAFLTPLVKRDRISRYMRIFAHETAQPSDVFRAFVQSGQPRIFVFAESVARRFLPAEAGPEEVAFATLWLAQQPIFFVRDAEVLAGPPFSIKFDEAGLDRLVDMLARLSLGGLEGMRAASSQFSPRA